MTKEQVTVKTKNEIISLFSNNTIQEILTNVFGFTYKDWSLLSKKQLKILLDFTISTFYEESSDFNFSSLLSKYNLKFIVTRQKKTIINNSEYVQLNNENELIFTKEFFDKFKYHIRKNLSEIELTEIDKDLEEQNCIIVTKNTTISKFEQDFDIKFSEDKFSYNKIKLKNLESLNFVKNKNEFMNTLDFIKKVKIKIIERKYNLDLTKSLKYKYVHSMLGPIEMYAAELRELPNVSTIKIDEISVPLSLLKTNPVSVINVYYYKCLVFLENGETIETLLESYSELNTTVYDAYVYVKLGTKTNLQYIKLVKYIKASEDYKDESFLINNKSHIVYSLWNNITKHIKSKGFKFYKQKSDLIIFMELLKLIYQFSGFDVNKKAHSLYVGLMSVGKSYTVDIFNYIKFPKTVKVTPSRITIPGLFVAANQEILLPDFSVRGATIQGAISTDNVFIEEIGKAVIDEKSSFKNEILETLKDSLFSNKIDLAKYGGGTVDRNAYITMTMNYGNDFIQMYRKKFENILISTELEYRKGKRALGEQDYDLIVQDNKVKISNLVYLARNYDIFLDLNQIPEKLFVFDDKTITDEEVIIFRNALLEFKKQFKTININTGLENPIVRRFLFSLYGTINEYKDSNDNKVKLLTKDDVDNIKYNITHEEMLGKLYIPNLRTLIENKIKSFMNYINFEQNKLFYYNLSRELLNFFATKYSNLSKLGDLDGDLLDVFQGLLFSLMFLNEEKSPSIETINILERWLFLQLNSITSSEASNYKILEKRVKYNCTQDILENILNKLNWRL